MSIKIFTDSTSDIPEELVKKYGIVKLPLMVNFEDGEYRDGVDITTEEFFKKLKESEKLPTTSQINPLTFVDAYKRELDKGNSIISIHIAGELSGTYQSAVTAKSMLGSENISVIDSRTGSIALGMIVLKAAELALQGLDREEIVERIEKYKGNVKLFIAVDTLEYLKKGGRLSSTQAALGGMFNIKPILLLVDGKVNVFDKVRGEKRVYKRIIEIIKESGRVKEGSTIGVANAMCPEKAEELKKAILEEVGQVNFIDTTVGSVVATHVGPGAFGFTID